jgi:PAS domain-containing protein
MNLANSDNTPLDFRLLFDSAPGLYLVLTPEFKIVTVNNAYAEVTQNPKGRDSWPRLV